MNDLETLEPMPLWQLFLALSKIPRGSGNEAAAAAWVAETARAAGCEVLRDAAGNVLARKAASRGREGRPGLALQAHVDMVCEKNEGTPHDFTKDPIAVYRDGDLLRARGTTLGADNGVGVAATLAVLAARDLSHPPLEVLVTVDEENGLSGAKGIAPGWLRSKRLINLDSEAEGELTIGCAGGVDTVATRPVTRDPAPAGWTALRLKVYGLKGGHSGIDISAGRVNALRLLGEILAAVGPKHRLRIARVKGGNKRNAIAREAWATLLVEPGRQSALAADVARLAGEWKLAIGAFDPGLTLALEPATAEPVLSAADARAVVGLLAAGPHGIEAMSPDVPGLVQTSTNMGLVETHADRAEVSFLTRSSVDGSKRALAARIAEVAALAGFEATHFGAYPGWRPEPSSEIVVLLDRTYRELAGKPMIVRAIHAGLECGLIGEKHPGMEMASIGPSMCDVHTPDEQVSIASVQGFWKFLTAILAKA